MWCLENVPLGPGPDASDEPGSSAAATTGKEGREGWRNDFWKTELRMLEAMLDADPRNCKLSTL
jgi:geranylgeranyl transferase type-2 subunit alpha